MKPFKLLLPFALASVLCLSSCDQLPEILDLGAEQCSATTQKGTRCKQKATKGSKYCSAHKRSSKKTTKRTTKRTTSSTKSSTKTAKQTKCKAKTNEGKRCSRYAVKYGYCSQHYKSKK